MTDQVLTSLGFLSVIPPLVTIVLALWTKRVVESLVAGIFACAWVVDYTTNGALHATLYSLPNTFVTLAGHPATDTLKGVGIVKDASRGQLIIFIVLLGSFMTVLDYGGGALDFAKRATKFIQTKTQALLVSMLIGFSIFTSAYFCIMVNGTVMRPIFDRLKISREKLAFYCDAMSAPTKAWLPISGWIAYMVTLLKENVPGVTEDNGLSSFIQTMPYNFYCWLMPIFSLLLAMNWIKDFGPMKAAEYRVSVTGLLHKPESTPMVSESKEALDASKRKNGHMMDMFIPMAVSVITLLVVGMWNPINQNFKLGLPKIAVDTSTTLNVGFMLGIIVAFFQYTRKKLMTPKEFLDHVVEGGKSAIIGAMIIIMAVTLGDMMKAGPSEGLGTANYLIELSKPFIIASLLPAMIFVIGSVISFATGSSWGTWALMMPIAMPIALAAGVNPFLTAAAVLSGGAFGDHCGPISDTNVMASLASNTDHLEHVRTQIPYAVAVAIVSFFGFVAAGTLGW
jgi:Na+/H+ antiporter NhaC